MGLAGKKDPKVLSLVGEGSIFMLLIGVHGGRLYGRDLHNRMVCMR